MYLYLIHILSIKTLKYCHHVLLIHLVVKYIMDTTIISGLINFTMVASFTRFNSYDWFTSFAWSIRKWSINKKLGSLENFTWSILKCGRWTPQSERLPTLRLASLTKIKEFALFLQKIVTAKFGKIRFEHAVTLPVASWVSGWATFPSRGRQHPRPYSGTCLKWDIKVLIA